MAQRTAGEPLFAGWFDKFHIYREDSEDMYCEFLFI